MKNKFLIFFLLFITFFLAGKMAFASVIKEYRQSSANIEMHSYAGINNQIFQQLGTGLSGTLGSATFYLSGTGNMAIAQALKIDCFTDSGYTIACATPSYGEYLSPYNLSYGSSPAQFIIGQQYDVYSGLPHAIGMTFDPTKYYQVMMSGRGNDTGGGFYYGGSTLTFPQATWSSGGIQNGTLGNFYFILDTASTPSPPTCTDPNASNYGGVSPCTYPGFLSAPLLSYSNPNSGTTTQNVVFTNEGFKYATSSTVVWRLYNFDTSQYYTIWSPISTASTTNNFFHISTSTSYYANQAPVLAFNETDMSLSTSLLGTATTTLAEGLYTGQAYLYQSNSEFDYDDINFVVVSSAYGGGSNFNPETGILPGTNTNIPTASSTLSQTNLLSFMNVPYLLKTKIPFAYFFQMIDILKVALSTSTSATLLPSSVIPIAWPTHFGAGGAITGTTTLSTEFFSTTTITAYITPTMRNLLRSVMVAILFFEVGYFLYHDARHRKHLF